jgi:hypothetical protein
VNGWRVANRVNNLDFSARGVVLVFAIGVDASARISRPLPNPVDSNSLTGLVGGRNVDVGLAPLLNVGSRLAKNMVRELLLTLYGDGTRVDLVAASIIVVLSSDLGATRVTASTGSVPLEDIDNLLSVGGFSSSVDKDSAAHLGLARLILRQSDVAVLKVLHGDVRARSSLETGVGGIIVVGSALAGVAEKISLIDASAAGAKGWHQVDDRVLVEAGGIGAINIATSVAIVASVVARSRVDDLHLLDPSVSG